MKYHPSCAMGGTAIDTLENEAIIARDAMNDALAMLANASPNGRDYPAGDLRSAEREWSDLAAKVRDVRDAFDERLEYLADKRDERIAQRG